MATATHGAREIVRNWHPQLVQTLIHAFEVHLDMVVSMGEDGKTATPASPTALDEQMGKRVRAHGARMAKQEKHFGVTTAADRCRRAGGVQQEGRQVRR